MATTHLKRKQIYEWHYKKHVGVKVKMATYYFCGKARNYTISAEHLHLVDCKKCLENMKRKPKKDGKDE
jgi:hypothetical protein